MKNQTCLINWFAAKEGVELSTVTTASDTEGGRPKKGSLMAGQPCHRTGGEEDRIQRLENRIESSLAFIACDEFPCTEPHLTPKSILPSHPDPD